MEIINNKLLSEVLGIEVRLLVGSKSEILQNYFNDDIDAVIPTNMVYYFNKENMSYESINIYELVYICKEWIHNNSRFQIRSYSGSSCYFIEVYHIDTCFVEFSIHDKEPDAIIKATQWVLDNFKKDINK